VPHPAKIEQFYQQVTQSHDDVGEWDFPYDDATHTISHTTNYMDKADAGPRAARDINEREIREWLVIAEIQVVGVEVKADGLTTIFHLNPADLT